MFKTLPLSVFISFSLHSFKRHVYEILKLPTYLGKIKVLIILFTSILISFQYYFCDKKTVK